MGDAPRLDPELVRDFVSNAHSDLGRVRDLFQQQPALVNAAWDWGNGDWETGLGAAAHVGRRDIALCLLENGARLDIFAAAMLGHLEIVRATLEAIPDARKWRGPHGIPLLKHAEAGGAMAAHVADFLRDLDRV
ncbi:MAG: ankyrin repeat domain-containing protein [Hyphomicrobiales bacterium]